MAYTEIHEIKSNLKHSIEYIINHNKTDYDLMSSFSCSAEFGDKDFLSTRKIHKAEGKVIARHIIQSFYPGEITKEKAHEIGIEFCKRFLEDKHEYIIATHIDKKHIHNHIIFNNVSFVTGKTKRTKNKMYKVVANISNEICRENDLTIIKEDYFIGQKDFEKIKEYDKILSKISKEDLSNLSQKNHIIKETPEEKEIKKDAKHILKKCVDEAIKKSKNLLDFLLILKNEFKFEIKIDFDRIYIKQKDDEKYTGTKSIYKEYTEEGIINRILENNIIKKDNNIYTTRRILDKGLDRRYIFQLGQKVTNFRLKESILEAINNSTSFESFLSFMQKNKGYDYVYGKNNELCFKEKHQKKFTASSRPSIEFKEENIKKKIEERALKQKNKSQNSLDI